MHTWQLMKPVRVTVDVPNSRASVYEYLDVMANHALFNDHLLFDWEYSGPARGVGSKARAKAKVGHRTDTIDIEVVSATAPHTIAEQNIGAKGRRRASGTYTLDELPDGGTRITFEYAWEQAPLFERLAGALVRASTGRALQRSLERLTEQLTATRVDTITTGATRDP